MLVALVIAGCAAAVASLTGSASQPLEGRVPGAITPASLAGYSYTIAVFPQVGAGTAGWESFIVYTRPDTAGIVQGRDAWVSNGHGPRLRWRYRPR